jgi:hypothetical protein
MLFANPLFLFGLVALAIPIIIHLFNFRKFQKVYFTNVKFIEDLQQQTQKQSQLKHLLILLMRMLAIAALVVAFAQPFIPVADATGDAERQNAVSIYIDNSFSMEAASPEGTLLDQAIKNAREIALAYKNSDRFQLLTNDFQGQHQRLVNREVFFEMLDEIDFTPVSRNISTVFIRQAELLNQNKGLKTAYHISDFQRGMADFENIAPDTIIKTLALPVEAEKLNNLYIDSIWFDAPVYRPGQLATLNVLVNNSSTEKYEKVPIRLMIDDVQRAIAGFDAEPGKPIELSLPFTNTKTGLHYGRLEITDFPITYDDAFFFTYDVKPELPLLVINSGEQSMYLNSMFANDSAFVFQNVNENQLDYSSFNRYSLIILNGLNHISSGLSQELHRYTQSGGNIAVFPGVEADPESYREFFLNLNTAYLAGFDTIQTRVSKINLESSIYDDVFESIPENIDLPVVRRHYALRRSSNSMMEPLLEMQNGEIFLGSEPTGRGIVYLFATPLDDNWTNFPRHAIFVPTLYKIALLSRPLTDLYFTAGENQNITLKNESTEGENILRIRKPEGGFEVIPQVRSEGALITIFTGNNITDAGHYNITANGQIISAIAFNYNRRESDMTFFSADELSGLFDDSGLDNFTVLKNPQNRSLTNVIAEINAGVRLWKLFIALALVFLLAEVALLRFWK